MELEWTWKRQGARGALAGLIFGTIFTVLGLGFLGVGGGSALWTQHFVSKSVAVEGTVTALREVQDAQNHSLTFAPVYDFVGRDGRSHSVTSTSSSNPAGFEVGDKVRVLYDPAHPQGAKIDSFGELWILPVIFSALGGFFTLFGIVALVIARAQRRRELAAMARQAGQPWAAGADATFKPDVTWTGRNIDPM